MAPTDLLVLEKFPSLFSELGSIFINFLPHDLRCDFGMNADTFTKPANAGLEIPLELC